MPHLRIRLIFTRLVAAAGAGVPVDIHWNRGNIRGRVLIDDVLNLRMRPARWTPGINLDFAEFTIINGGVYTVTVAPCIYWS